MTERWRFPIGGVHPMAPTVADGVVYAGGECLFALDFDTGEERSSICPQTPEAEGKVLVSTTPVVADGTVYFGDTSGALCAADATSGQLIWIDEDHDRPQVSSPLILDDVIWSGSLNKRQYILDRATGEPLWHFGALSLVMGQALLNNGIVYFADESLITAMPRPEVGKPEGQVLWDRSYTKTYDRTAAQQPSATSGMVYLVDAYPAVQAADPTSLIHLAVGDDRLVVATRELCGNRGYLAAVDRSDGKPFWRVPLGLGNGPAVIAGDRVIVTEWEDVAAFSVSDGTELWRTSTGIASALTLAGNAIYAGIRSEAKAGAVVVLSPDAGTVLARIEVPDVEGLGSPAIADDCIVVGSVNLESDDGYLFAFDDPLPMSARSGRG